jgi:hypothetical protein
MKDDLNDEVFHGTLKIFIPFDGVLHCDGMSKLGDEQTRGALCYTF